MNRQRVKCIYCGRERCTIDDTCAGCGATRTEDVGEAHYLEDRSTHSVIYAFPYGVPIYGNVVAFPADIARTLLDAR